LCSPTSSASMEEATTSIGTLTDLVHQLLQSSQEMSTRLGSLEGQLRAPNVASTYSTDPSNDEDDVSTIIPRRPVHTTLTQKVALMNARSVFDFDDDLYGSRVYVRTLRRKSFQSLRSDTNSFGWSCLSGLSMADVSNLSVVSLPISCAVLKNSEHYSLMETPRERVFKSLQPYPGASAQQGSQPPEANIFLCGKQMPYLRC